MSGPRDVGDLVARLAEEGLDRAQRSRLLVTLAGRLGGRASLSARRLTDLLTEQVAPRLPVRDLVTLRHHHNGLSGDDLSRALIRNAAMTTAAVGAAAGAVTAVEVAAPPTLLTAPVMLSAATLAVVAVELKLVAELHVVYGRAPIGTRTQVTVAYLTAWAGRHAVPGAGAPSRPDLAAALTTAMRQQLRQRMVRRLGRNLTALVPFLAGAVAGAELNRRETRGLGEALLKELSR
jgi:hypothetical protein